MQSKDASWKRMLGHTAIACVAYLVATEVDAQIVTDGSVGAQTALVGPSYSIDASLGRQQGANLFHSFSTFNVGAGQSANFGSGQGVANIIARVTGPGSSSINGNVYANANLFLLNPQGILFGATATLNVTGSFHASTADYLRLSDGSRIYASLSPASTFTTASPAAFGFLDGSVAPIVAQGSNLSVPSSRSLSLIGGHITLANSRISVPSGQLNMVAVASPGEVAISPNSTQVSGFTTFGDIQLSNAQVNFQDEAAASIFIRGGHFVMENNAAIYGLTTQASAPRTIDIDVDTLQLNSSNIASGATGNGAGTNTVVHARQIEVMNGSKILNAAAGANVGGDIVILADDLHIEGGLAIVGTGAAAGSGRAGNVSIQANTIAVADGTISASSDTQGGAGNISVTADSVTLARGGGIQSGTTGAGNGGAVAIRAREFTIDGTQGSLPTSVTVRSAGGSGNAGTIALNVDSLVLHNGSIASNTNGVGRGGDVSIAARSITLDQGAVITTETGATTNQNQGQTFGAGGAIAITAQSMQVLSGGRVSANTFSNGSSGSINIQSNQLTIDQRSATSTTGITANTGSATNSSATGAGGNLNLQVNDLQVVNHGVISTNTYGSGTAGRIDVLSDRVNVSGEATISALSQSLAPNAGRANDINIRSNSLTVSDLAKISNSTSGSGSAGQLIITAQTLDLFSGGVLQSSSLGTAVNPGAAGDIYIQSGAVRLDAANILALSYGAADPGSMVISARSLTLSNGSSLSATSSSAREAGSIVVTATDSIDISGGSRIATDSTSGSGGDIRLFAANNFIIRESVISTSSLGAASNGGNISIDPTFTVVDNSQIIARAVGGNGGRIDISTGYLLLSANSTIDASSALGISGSVEIAGVDVDLNADIAPLPKDFLNATKWLATACASRQGSDVSQFTVNGRDGAYRSPSDFLLSPMQFDAPATAPMNGRGANASVDLHRAGLPQLSFVPLCLQSGG